MLIMLFMALALGIYAHTASYNPTRTEEFREASKGVAEAMALYHALAVRQCLPPNPVCAPGDIIPEAPSGSNINMNNMHARFQSATNGVHLVTVMRPFQIQRLDNASGFVSSALRDVTMDSVLAGSYVASSGSVSGTTQTYRVRLPDGTVPVMTSRAAAGTLSSRLTGIPANIGSITLVNGTPMLATPLN
jgi:hypothetical protein